MSERRPTNPDEFINRLQKWHDEGKLARPVEMMISVGLPRRAAEAYGEAERQARVLMSDNKTSWRDPSGIFGQYFLAYHLAIRVLGDSKSAPFIRAYTHFAVVNYATNLQQGETTETIVELMRLGDEKAREALSKPTNPSRAGLRDFSGRAFRIVERQDPPR